MASLHFLRGGGVGGGKLRDSIETNLMQPTVYIVSMLHCARQWDLGELVEIFKSRYQGRGPEGRE